MREGEFKNYELNGQGTKKSFNETRTGQFKDDKLHGQGKVIQNGIVIYEGECKEGEPRGHGKVFHPGEKITLEGDFTEGSINDVTLTLPDGKIIQADKMLGRAVLGAVQPKFEGKVRIKLPGLPMTEMDASQVNVFM